MTIKNFLTECEIGASNSANFALECAGNRLRAHQMDYRLTVTIGPIGKQTTILEADTNTLNECMNIGEAFMVYNTYRGFFARIYRKSDWKEIYWMDDTSHCQWVTYNQILR